MLRNKLYLFCKRTIYFILKKLIIFIPISSLRRKTSKKIKYIFLRVSNFDLNKAPYLMSNAQTLEYIIQNKMSIARFGDGEINYMLNKKFKHFFQPYNLLLCNKLKNILKNPYEKCLIGLPFSLFNKQHYGSFGLGFQINCFYKFLPYLIKNYKYASATCFCEPSFEEGNLELIKNIWKNQNIIIVTGKKSTFIYDERLFSDIKSAKFIYSKPTDAFNEYDKIINDIVMANKDKSKLILLSLGLTATSLAYDLSKLGYWCIDIGHIANYYLTFMGEIANIEELRRSKKIIDGVTDIKDIYKKII